MNILFIHANPSKAGFSYKILDTLVGIYKKRNSHVDVLDLYTTDLKQDFLTYEDKYSEVIDPTRKKIQDKITWADEIVFVFPIWWWDAPAILKNFLDCNFTAWFAFKYVNGKAVGLLTGKSARIFTTSWAPGFFYSLLLRVPFLWKMNRIQFCGIKQKNFTIFGKMDSSGTNKNAYLEKLEHIIK